MIKYSYFCEDSAIQIFIEKILDSYLSAKKKITFEKHLSFCSQHCATNERNRDKVIEQFLSILKLAFSDEEKVNLFVVGYDFDHASIDSYSTHIKNNLNKISKVRDRNNTLFCIPVKCIEYWLWYVKYQNTENGMKESFLEHHPDYNNHRVKLEVYNGRLDEKGRYIKRPTSSEEILAKEILLKLDIDHLRKVSPSFNVFINHLKDFCSKG